MKPGLHTLTVLLPVLAWGCGEASYNEIELMPAPTVFETGAVDPFQGRNAETLSQHATLFYATDRQVAGPEDASEFYANKRGVALRVGTARVQMDPPIQDWTSLREITLSADRPIDPKISVISTQEIGPLPFSSSDETGAPLPSDETALAARAFSDAINAQLRISGNADVFIYIHGYNVDFEYPTLVAKELQHYLGYQGAFISYNWPASPSRLAYFKDLETADATRRNLRELITFLSQKTNARRVHLIGYSAGSRLAFEAAYQVALQSKAAGRRTAKLGQVILIGSDLDRTYFTQALADDLLGGMDHLTLYMSESDAALRLSEIVFGRNRLGQIKRDEVLPGDVAAKLVEETRLSLIDASHASGANLGNGHWYFRSSPWVSSDIFLTLLGNDLPQRRGLVRRAPQDPIWTFPADYEARAGSNTN